MNKYLKKIETTGIIMLFLSVVLGHTVSVQWGAIAAIVGLFLWVATVLYKAFKWNEYRKDNILNIYIMLGAIIIIFITLYFIR